MFVESSAATIASVLHPDSAAILDGSPQNPLNGGESWPCVTLVLCSYCSDDALVDLYWGMNGKGKPWLAILCKEASLFTKKMS